MPEIQRIATNIQGPFMIDLEKIGEFITKKELWEKPFNQWSKEEIQQLAQVFFSSPSGRVPRDGWKTPYVKDDHFIIPFDAHPKYYWWTPGGQSILETLKEIKAPSEIINANQPHGWNPNGLKKH